MNVQGDEPLIEGFVIDAAVEALAETPEAPMATVVHRAEPDALDDPNRVKVVLDRARPRALLLARRFRSARDGGDAPLWQHVGLYAYRREFLRASCRSRRRRRARRGARAAARARARAPDPLRR